MLYRLFSSYLTYIVFTYQIFQYYCYRLLFLLCMFVLKNNLSLITKRVSHFTSTVCSPHILSKSHMSIKATDFSTIITDIEGTACPITFVHDVLFPYVKNNLSQYLDKTWDTELTQVCLYSIFVYRLMLLFLCCLSIVVFLILHRMMSLH